MGNFTVKTWTNSPSTTTPLSAAAMEDLESRLSGYTDATFATGLDGAKPAASTVPNQRYYATDSNALYYSDGTTWRTIYGSRGATNISASESRTNVAYGLLTTPDQVTNIVLPTNGLIVIGYQATWQESVAGAARAAIFIGANQLKIAQAAAASPVTQAAATSSGSTAINIPLVTTVSGLASCGMAGVSYAGDVTTGQVIGIASIGSVLARELGGTVDQSTVHVDGGEECSIFAAAGTYTISVQFKATSGSVTASNRKLWVQAHSYG